ncbi:RHS repeat-associated core domain-containing protein, partial [Parvularcula maris]
VHGPGSDEALVWYEGSGTGDKRYFSADERGSITLVTRQNGTVLRRNQYDADGRRDSDVFEASRFGYTGQTKITGTSLWHYKARAYSPFLGRFLQTDPIGYGDGLNWYAYVGGDAV